ncbi:MAG: peptidoglycan-binding domain-containing protein [Candidatus Paceibacterota bacterium]|jgi:hypothetical protein
MKIFKASFLLILFAVIVLGGFGVVKSADASTFSLSRTSINLQYDPQGGNTSANNASQTIGLTNTTASDVTYSINMQTVSDPFAGKINLLVKYNARSATTGNWIVASATDHADMVIPSQQLILSPGETVYLSVWGGIGNTNLLLSPTALQLVSNIIFTGNFSDSPVAIPVIWTKLPYITPTPTPTPTPSTTTPTLYSTEPSPGRFIPGQTIKVYALGLRSSAMNSLYIDGKGFNNMQSWNPTGTNSGVPNSYETLVALPLDLSAGAHILQMETSDVVENFGKVLSNSLPLNIFRTRAEAENPEDPTVTYVNPASAKPGDTVTVYGTNFHSDSYVMLDPYLDSYSRAQMGTRATTVTQTPTSISFIVPTKITAGSMYPLIYNLHRVTVFPSKNKQATTVAYNGSLLNRYTIPNNGGEYSNGYFNIVSAVTSSTPQAPVITSISSSSIPQGGSGSRDNAPASGATVTITGSGFSSTSAIVVDDDSNQYIPDGMAGVTSTGFPVVSWTTTSITFRVPSNIAVGQHSIQVGSCGNHGSPCGAFLSNPILVTITPRGTAMGSTPGYATSNFTPIPPLTCTLPQTLVNGVCTTPSQTPPPTCTFPKTLVNNVCTNPTSTSTPLPILGCSAGNIFNTQTGLPCVNNVGNDNQSSGTPAPYNFGTSTLRNGSRGEAVMELQRFLNDKLNLGLAVDGKLGPLTIAVVKEWQTEHGLVADGLIGKMTKAQMLAEVE